MNAEIFEGYSCRSIKFSIALTAASFLLALTTGLFLSTTPILATPLQPPLPRRQFIRSRLVTNKARTLLPLSSSTQRATFTEQQTLEELDAAMVAALSTN